jgi:hypothetical protein
MANYISKPTTTNLNRFVPNWIMNVTPLYVKLNYCIRRLQSAFNHTAVCIVWNKSGSNTSAMSSLILTDMIRTHCDCVEIGTMVSERSCMSILWLLKLKPFKKLCVTWLYPYVTYLPIYKWTHSIRFQLNIRKNCLPFKATVKAINTLPRTSATSKWWIHREICSAYLWLHFLTASFAELNKFYIVAGPIQPFQLCICIPTFVFKSLQIINYCYYRLCINGSCKYNVDVIVWKRSLIPEQLCLILCSQCQKLYFWFEFDFVTEMQLFGSSNVHSQSAAAK